MTGGKHEYLVDEAVELAKAGVEGLAPDLDPDEDWEPVMVGITEEKADVMGFPLLPGLKDVLVDVLAKIAKVQHYKAMAIVTTAWMIDTASLDPDEAAALREAHEAGEHVSASEHPKRVEIVMIQAIDPEVMRFESARVYRHEDAPPTLGPWQPFGGDEIAGRFAALRTVLR
jgi:hypothetical protein